MADKFKPGLRNIYLMQSPRSDNGNQTLAVVALSGRKGDKFDGGMAFSFSNDTYFAFLQQVNVETNDELIAVAKRHHERWVRVFDLSPVTNEGGN